MRVTILAFAMFAISQAHASEIREFNLKTTELLGRQLYEHRNRTPASLSDREANALEATKAALNGRIDKSFRFIILHAPTRSGYLVYALATSNDSSDVVLGIHYRVSVFANGNKVERVDALSRGNLIVNRRNVTAVWTIHLVSRTPIETQVYLSLLHSTPLYAGTPDHAIWKIQEGRISRIRPAR